MDEQLFESVDSIPRTKAEHYTYAVKVASTFAGAGIPYARLTNVPNFECTFQTWLDTLRTVCTPRHVRVIKRGDDLYLLNEKLAGCR